MIETVEDRFTAKARLTATWERTDRIFEILAGDAWLAQPIALRHPFIFYLGHLPAFAWNHVGARVLGAPRSTRPSTSSSRAASIPTWTTPRTVTITRRCLSAGRHDRGARLPRPRA